MGDVLCRVRSKRFQVCKCEINPKDWCKGICSTYGSLTDTLYTSSKKHPVDENSNNNVIHRKLKKTNKKIKNAGSNIRDAFRDREDKQKKDPNFLLDKRGLSSALSSFNSVFDSAARSDYDDLVKTEGKRWKESHKKWTAIGMSSCSIL